MPPMLGPFLGDLEPSDESPWMATLDERTKKHVAYARHYAANFAHGAPGHLDLMTIATLAQLLDRTSARPEGDPS